MTTSQLVDLYVRLSIDLEGKDSLERQEADLRAWADREGLTVRKVWRDAGKSGYKPGTVRADFDSAVAAVTAGEVGTLAVWKLDRLSRRGAGQVGTILDAVEAAGSRLWFLKDSLDSSIQGHRMVIVMVSEQARGESANTATRMKSKNESNVSKGFPIVGKRRFGFKPGNIEEWEPDPRAVPWKYEHEADLVRWAFETMATGGTVYGIGKTLGKPPLRVREILTNPSYAGYVVRRGERFEAHESIARVVDRELFEDVQVILSDAKRKTTPGPRRRHLASGLALCGVCHRGLVSMTQYACPDPARHVFINRQELDRRLSKAVREELARLGNEPQPEVESVETRTLRAERADLQGRRERAQRLALMEDVDEDVLQKDLRTIRVRLDAIEERLSDLAMQNTASGVWEIANALRETQERIAAKQRTWDSGDVIDVILAGEDWNEAWEGLTLEDKRALVADLLVVKVNSAKVTAKPVKYRLERQADYTLLPIKTRDAVPGLPRVSITPKRMETK